MTGITGTSGKRSRQYTRARAVAASGSRAFFFHNDFEPRFVAGCAAITAGICSCRIRLRQPARRPGHGVRPDGPMVCRKIASVGA
jgi:hypothetical protein